MINSEKSVQTSAPGLTDFRMSIRLNIQQNLEWVEEMGNNTLKNYV